jgi:hypothetical protein
MVQVLLLALMRECCGELYRTITCAESLLCLTTAGRIVASADECQGHWQQKDYKAFSPGTDW